MEGVGVKRKSIFSRLFSFAAFKPKSKVEFESVSKFDYFLGDVPMDEENYPFVEQTVALCDEAYKIAKIRLDLVNKIKDLNDKLTELDCFNDLTEEDSAHLKDLLSRFTSLAKESNQLMYQITSFDESLQYMERLENDAKMTMPNIQDAENRLSILRQDIGYLVGEKSELEYEKEVLEKGLVFIYKFSIFMVIIFGISTLVLGFLYLFENSDIFYPTSILIISIILLIAILYLFRRRILYELNINIRKQRRAVDFLNKKNAVYAHYKNFLNYVYKKYKVKSSRMLENNLSDYTNYKHLTNRFDSIRNIMHQTEEQIEFFLRDKKLDSMKSSTEKFAQTVNIDDKKHFYTELRESRNQLETNLIEYDNRHGEIWDMLVRLSENDKTENKVIGKIIKSYLDEVGKIFTMLVSDL